MNKSQNALALLNEELLTLLQGTPHVLELSACTEGLIFTKRACECSTQHIYCPEVRMLFTEYLTALGIAHTHIYCPEVRMLFSWAIIWDAYHHLQQGYAFKARAHKFTLMLHHSPFSLKLRLRQRGIKLVQPCPKTSRRLVRHLELVIPWGLLQGLYVRNTSGI